MSLRAFACRLWTEISEAGVSGAIGNVAGGSAALESEMTFTGETSFEEAGTMLFRDAASCLRFSTLCEGHLGPSADGAIQNGAVVWTVDGGQGLFEGATGLITSNFIVGADGDTIANHFAVIFIRE